MVHFSTDQQTLDDLSIFGKPGSDSIFGMYNKTQTTGGAAQLEEMFRYPMADAEKINQRSKLIQAIVSGEIAFPFTASLFPVIEKYLENKDERSKLTFKETGITDRLKSLVAIDPHEKNIMTGVMAIRKLMDEIKTCLLNVSGDLKTEIEKIGEPLADADFDHFLKLPVLKKRSYEEMAEQDVLLRFRKREKVRSCLHAIYHLDALISVGKVAGENHYCFPVATPPEMKTVSFTKVFHPMVKGAITNSLTIDPSGNIVFLTGANMAGKSTFMKSLGIAMYLAHIGFPVAAAAMTFSVKEGIYTSINLPDNLGKGISHFYAEVLRVKKVTAELVKNKQLFIIVDELFRGTNVKDAYEATVALTAAFARKSNCMFIVSTHIMEAGEALQHQCKNIQFVFLPTRMRGNVPEYTYRLEKGITADRHGMIIVENEGILELLSQKNKSELP